MEAHCLPPSHTTCTSLPPSLPHLLLSPAHCLPLPHLPSTSLPALPSPPPPATTFSASHHTHLLPPASPPLPHPLTTTHSLPTPVGLERFWELSGRWRGAWRWGSRMA